jgi:hypothetical protein
LITKDDIDWDIRLKKQLREFAYGLQELRKRLGADHSPYTDGWEYVKHSPHNKINHLFQSNKIRQPSLDWTHARDVSDIPSSYPLTILFHANYYSFLPDEELYINYNDSTVPRSENLRSFKINGQNWLHLITDYPEHTRFVH